MGPSHDVPPGESDGTASTFADKVLDLVVFAPVGVLDHLAQWVPKAVAAGRQRVGMQVRTARWIGEMAVGVGRSKVSARLTRRPAADRSVERPAATVTADVTGPGRTEAEPFAGYDSLPAAELVAMLVRLSRDELVAVRAYEGAGRGRRTVLARVDQLLGA